MQQTARSGEKAPLFGGRKPLFTQSQLLKLTWPLLVEQFLAVTVGMADTMMVSRCGEAAISGVSLVDMINNLIIVLFSALATGGAVVVSQFLGAREQKSANKSAGQLILLSGILGLGVGVLCFVLARPMIRLFYGSIDADVLDAGTLYLKIIAVSYPFLALYNAGAALFRSMGNSRISMQISVLMNIINIVGNAVCIFGLKMGVDGVAWPSVVSRVVAAVLILGKCYQKGHALQVPRTVQLDVGMTRRILGIGIPSAFENSLFEAGRILVVSMISTFGTVQIPVTLPTWDEAVGTAVDIAGFNRYLLDCIHRDPGVPVYTIHAEVEGIAYADQFNELLTMAAEEEIQFCPLSQLLPADFSELPSGKVVRGELAGREGWLGREQLLTSGV